MDRSKPETATSGDLDVAQQNDRKRSQSVDSRGSSISSEMDSETHKMGRRTSKESTISEEKTMSQRLSKAIEEEDAFLDYIKALPAMSSEKVEAYKKSQTPVYKRSTSEVVGGLDHLDNLYKLMEHLGQLRIQNSKLQERVKYLENIAHEDMVMTHRVEETDCDDGKFHSKSKRSTKCKSSHYGIRQSFMKSSRERSRSVGVEEILKSTTHYRLAGTQEIETRGSEGVKAKVSKWTKVKEAFRWEKASNGVLPEAKSQDSGLGVGDDVRYLRVPHPHALSDNSSVSISPADSVLSGQSLSQPAGSKDCLSMPHISSSVSTSEEDLADQHFHGDGEIPTFKRECDEHRRSKSLDGETNLIPCELLECHDIGKDQKTSHSSNKGIKTPWGKMKDIIQTRTGSIKKRKGDSDIEEDSKSGIEISLEDAHYESQVPSSYVQRGEAECEVVGKRRLGPMLTITLPSTEELHRGKDLAPKVSTKPPPSPQTEEKHVKCSAKPKALEEDLATQHVPRKVSGGSAGASPPTPRRLSKWSKVKNAFLTSSSASEDCLHRGSNSVPSSPVKSATFGYDIESDELSSGEFMDDSTRDDDVFPDPVDEMYGLTKNENIQAEIQRNYEELQLKLSQEFHKKLCEWERIKSSGSPGTPPCSSKMAGSGFSSGTSSIGEDLPHDKGFRKKMEEWDKIKSPSTSGGRHRESVTLQQLGEENLSADFKKKLEEWEKIKSVPIPQTPDLTSVSQPQFRKKITEWQLWRPGVMSSKSDAGISVGVSSPPAELPEDFYKKLLEWERLKHGSSSSTQPENESPGNKTPSPGSLRREGSDYKSSKSQHSPTNKKEKGGADFGFQLRIQKSKSHHEVKELAWLEKELHKIEREKQRLERERDKYLEREARLEKLRKAIGANVKKQEVLIPTSTGLFRFEGISQKFTRKLYEWEKARGIGPEASTFALLDPGYQPPSPNSNGHRPDGVAVNGSLLTRSKSMGSVVDIVSMAGNQNTLTHQPSSLSLNHMEQLESNQISCALMEELCEPDISYDEEPQALIVDVEDVIEETASPLEQTPAVETQTPVYCYAPSEVTRLIDSSGSDSDKDATKVGVQAQSNIELLHENINLLDKLQRKEDICRELECKIEDVEDKLNTTERIHREHLGILVQDDPFLKRPMVKEKSLDQIKEKLLELESQQERLREEGATLQHSFVEHSEQQALIAQDLVGKVKQLQDNFTGSPPVEPSGPEQLQGSDTLTQVQHLATQLLSLAKKLELAVSERNQEISRLRKALVNTGRPPALQKLRLNQHWFSSESVSSLGVTDTFPSQDSEVLTLLPVLLTDKLQELKAYLGSLTPIDVKPQPVFPKNQGIKIIYPDSPEVETTFVFNIGKKNKKESVDQENQSSPLENKEGGSYTGTTDVLPEATFTFKPTTSLSNKNNKSDTSQVTELNIDDCTEEKEYDNGKKKKSNIDSVVELTYPIKTYFKEDSRDTSLKKNIESAFSDSDTDLENGVKQKVKSRSVTGNTDYDDAKEYFSVKKYRKSRNSGAYERRRSRTDSNNENTDEEEERVGLYETCSGKNISNFDLKFKKNPKLKTFVKDDVDNSKDDVNDDDNKYRTECTESTLKQVNSPKCISRRNKKPSKTSKDDNSNSEESMTSSSNKFCCDVQNEEIVPSNQEMTVNVFVPTTRKIFSPVRKDSKGETSTVISYIVEESAPDVAQNILVNNDKTDITKSKDDDEISKRSKTVIDNKVKNTTDDCNYKESASENKASDKIDEDKPTYDFILPPCWIIKQARAQSASPAMQRRAIQRPWNKEKLTDSIEISSNNQHSSGEIAQTLNKEARHLNLNSVNRRNENELADSVYQNSSTLDLYNQKESSTKEYCRKSSSSESVENNKPFRKEGTSIPSSLKLRSEAGFPPISPLTVRREMKVLKETAPSIRMMIAKYNQKVHESQELSGTKSPDSGGQSPVAWRSPVTERRIKAQLEKYQDEVRKALQRSPRKDFCPNSRLGQVQKSASAGYIRPFDKECSNDSMNEKSEEKDLSQTSQYHGILKSSSAGAIKSFSPILSKQNDTKKAIDKAVDTNSKPASTMITLNTECKSTGTLEYFSQKHLLQSDSAGFNYEIQTPRKTSVSNISAIPAVLDNYGAETSYVDLSPEATRVRALKLKKAKEEFLLRGFISNSGNNDNPNQSNSPSTPDTPVQSEILSWTNSKSRLSQVSCGSESSYENAPMILVSGRQQACDVDRTLLVKSASAGMINIDSSGSPAASCETLNPIGNTTQGAIPKSRSGILSRFRKARFKKHKEKDPSKLNTVSSLCRQSLVVDISKTGQNSGDGPLPSTSKSCPSSPVLHKKDQNSSGSWIRNPRRIFKPK